MGEILFFSEFLFSAHLVSYRWGPFLNKYLTKKRVLNIQNVGAKPSLGKIKYCLKGGKVAKRVEPNLAYLF